MFRRGDQEIAFPTFLFEYFLHLHGAFEGVARFVLSDYMIRAHAPTRQVLSGNSVCAFILGERVDVATRDDNRSRCNLIEPQGLFDAAEHRIVERSKWNEAF